MTKFAPSFAAALRANNRHFATHSMLARQFKSKINFNPGISRLLRINAGLHPTGHARRLPPRLQRLQLSAVATMAPNLTLYTDNTPNGFKASVTLEELGLEYETKHIKISTGAQKEPDFLKINPNGRIPAMVDHSADDLRVFETGSIMLYLCEYYDKEHKLLPADRKNRTEAINWLMWQMGGLGPMQGQANHFRRYAPEHVQYGIDRYTNETRRLYKVLDTALEGKEFLVDNKFSIADIASYCWVVSAQWAIEGFEFDEFPNMKAWKGRIDARPATKRGMAVPEPSDLASAAKDPKRLAEIKESVQGMMVKKGD